MIDTSNQTKLDKIQALKDAYCAELPPCVEAIVQLWRNLCASSAWNVDFVEEIKQKAHILSGSAGMFGMMDISITAGAVEEQMLLWNQRPNPKHRPASDNIQKIDALVSLLQPSTKTTIS
ncbi:hypothetical protein CCP2SC5_80039 [Azospirillaceae bacterium]